MDFSREVTGARRLEMEDASVQGAMVISTLGGRIVAEYDSLSRKVKQLYTMREMVLPEDKLKIFDETLNSRLEDTNQQLKKWILRWRPVIDHSMKRVKELAKENSKPI
jgi:hypothetical protein